MISIHLNEKQVNDLVDEIWRNDYEKRFIDPVFGLRTLYLMITASISQTEFFPSKDLNEILNGILEEVERILEVIDDTVSLSENNSGDNEDSEEMESFVELADSLEAWFEDLDEIDDSEFSESQLEDFESIESALTDQVWRTIGALRGSDHFEVLGIKWNQNTIAACSDPALCLDIYNKAINVALADWANPNTRCLAITIALAITVSPDVVFVSTNILKSGGESFNVQYRGISVYFSNNQKSKSFTGGPILVEQDGDRMVQKITPLKNLAQTYDDHYNDVRVREFLNDYLPKANNATDTAAVLALAWAMLQRMKVDWSCPGYTVDLSQNAKPIPYESKFKSKDLDIWIDVNKNSIVFSKFS